MNDLPVQVFVLYKVRHVETIIKILPNFPYRYFFINRRVVTIEVIILSDSDRYIYTDIYIYIRINFFFEMVDAHLDQSVLSDNVIRIIIIIIMNGVLMVFEYFFYFNFFF